MKFSLKTLAVAVALAAAAGSASAKIDDGATGNGELFFSAWDGAKSYVFDMNTTIDAYESAFNAAGKINLVWAADFSSTYASWLATANKSTLEWSVLALDASGQRRILSTVGAATLPTNNSKNDALRNGITATQQYLPPINAAIVGNSYVVTDSTAPTYAGKMGNKIFGSFNFDTTGSFANNSYANGVGFEKTLALATGIQPGTNNPYIDEGTAVRSWVDGNGLHIAAVAAVPEPSEYALLLAGLGLMGAIARRRKNARI